MPTKQYHQTVVKLAVANSGFSQDEIDNLSGWRGYSNSAAAKHGYDVYCWLRKHGSRDGVQVAVSDFCDREKFRPEIYKGLTWLRDNAFVVQRVREGVRSLTVKAIPAAPEGSDPRRSNKGVSTYGTVVLLQPNAAGDPCPAQPLESELESRVALFELDSATGSRRHALYLELRSSVGAIHWAHLDHTSSKTKDADFAFLEDVGLVVQCLQHGVLVVTSPLSLDWRPEDEQLICDQWVEDCRAAAKRVLLARTSDSQLLIDFYLDLCRHRASDATLTQLDRQAVGWLLKSRTFVEIRPSLAYFMCSATEDLGGEQTGKNIRGYGLTLQTYYKNFAAVELGFKENSKHYVSNPDNAWEHYLVSGDIVKWRINPLSPHHAQKEEARKAELTEARRTGRVEPALEATICVDDGGQPPLNIEGEESAQPLDNVD